jgi:AbrB family looped-hinge helix DNA binding protein
METTKLSTRGQVVIPLAIREKLGLEAGAEFTVQKQGDGILLKPRVKRKKLSYAELNARIEAMPKYTGKPISVEEMDEAVTRMIREEWSR